MRWWKWIGLAGLAGVAASGAVIARDERQRRSYTPQEVRDRLHERASWALADEAAPVGPGGPGDGSAGGSGDGSAGGSGDGPAAPVSGS